MENFIVIRNSNYWSDLTRYGKIKNIHAAQQWLVKRLKNSDQPKKKITDRNFGQPFFYF